MRSLRVLVQAFGALAAVVWLVAAAQADPAPAAHGGKPAATIPAATPVQRLSRSTAEWSSALAGIPALATLASSFAPLPSSATREALERGGQSRDSVSTWSFVEGSFAWSPRPDRTFWIVTGTAGPRIVIAVLDPGEAPRHLASTLLLESSAALAVGWSTTEPELLLWTTCYGCPGLGGSIRLDSAGRPVIEYR